MLSLRISGLHWIAGLGCSPFTFSRQTPLKVRSTRADENTEPSRPAAAPTRTGRTTPVKDDEIARSKRRIAEVGQMESVRRSEFANLLHELQAIPLRTSEDCLRRAILRNRLADVGTEIDTLGVRQVRDAELCSRWSARANRFCVEPLYRKRTPPASSRPHSDANSRMQALAIHSEDRAELSQHRYGVGMANLAVRRRRPLAIDRSTARSFLSASLIIVAMLALPAMATLAADPPVGAAVPPTTCSALHGTVAGTASRLSGCTKLTTGGSGSLQLAMVPSRRSLTTDIVYWKNGGTTTFRFTNGVAPVAACPTGTSFALGISGRVISSTGQAAAIHGHVAVTVCVAGTSRSNVRLAPGTVWQF